MIRLDLSRCTKTHLECFQALRELGIGVNLHYIPIYHQPYYQNLGFTRDSCPEAESYYSEAISLPMYSGLTDAQQEHIVNNVAAVLTV